MKKPNDDNIEETLKNKEKAYVLFYASWCPFSQKFLPIFQEHTKNHPQECLSVMIDFKPDLCDKYRIDYYPTVILFKKGKIEKKLEATPGKGLTKKQLEQLAANQ